VQQEAVNAAIELVKYFKIKPNKQLLLSLLQKMNSCFTNHVISQVWTTDNTKKI
jgi:hypothetical protein